METANTFEARGREWYAKNRTKWVEKTASIIKSCLGNNVYPAIGQLPIASIRDPELLAIVDAWKLAGRITRPTAPCSTADRC